MDLPRKRIGELTPGIEQRALYRRDNGKTYCLITPEWCTPVDVDDDERSFSGTNEVEPVDPYEEVEVICDGIGVMLRH